MKYIFIFSKAKLWNYRLFVKIEKLKNNLLNQLNDNNVVQN
jgi:hypothetical protein